MMKNSRAFAIAFALTTLLGCTTAAKTVATAQNGYDFREVRYEEACGTIAAATMGNPLAVQCKTAKTTLDAALKHLHECFIFDNSNPPKKILRFGAFPLQLAAIKADAKALGKMTVTK